MCYICYLHGIPVILVSDVLLSGGVEVLVPPLPGEQLVKARHDVVTPGQYQQLPNSVFFLPMVMF